MYIDIHGLFVCSHIYYRVHLFRFQFIIDSRGVFLDMLKYINDLLFVFSVLNVIDNIFPKCWNSGSQRWCATCPLQHISIMLAQWMLAIVCYMSFTTYIQHVSIVDVSHCVLRVLYNIFPKCGNSGSQPWCATCPLQHISNILSQWMLVMVCQMYFATYFPNVGIVDISHGVLHVLYNIFPK